VIGAGFTKDFVDKGRFADLPRAGQDNGPALEQFLPDVMGKRSIDHEAKRALVFSTKLKLFWIALQNNHDQKGLYSKIVRIGFPKVLL
jgi:hypothetical protein